MIKNTIHTLSQFVFGTRSNFVFVTPKRLGSYTVVKTLLKEKLSDTCVLKVRSEDGNFYVAKVWQGNKKNYSYDSLQDEYQTYKILHKASKKISNEFKSINIKIPKIYDFVDKKNIAYLILEFIDGTTLEESKTKNVIEILNKTTDFLETIGKKITDDDKKCLRKRTYTYHLISYPIFLIRSLVSNRSELKTIMNKVLTFFSSITIFKEDLVLLHGDLNLKNIIIKDNIIYPIDFQFTSYGLKEHGLANTLRYMWKKKDSRFIYINYIYGLIKKNIINRKLLTFLLVVHGTQGLIATNFSKKEIKSISNYLKVAPSLFFHQVLDFRSLLYKAISMFDIFSIDKKSPIVLCYHSFTGNNDRYSISIEEFEKQISKISKKTNFISYLDLFNKKIANGVLITIDDGLKSVLKILPITRKYKIPVLLFVISDSKRIDRIELNTSEEVLTWNDIKMLLKEGWSIGSHSATHQDFSKINTNELTSEIKKSKITIEKKIKKTIDCFAYPKGQYSEKVINSVKEAGYKYAFSILPGRVSDKNNKLVIPRTVIDDTHSEKDFPYLFSVSWLKFRSLTNTYKLWERFMA